ncbi:hypothetical protein [Natrarchaeobaculum aegyptiacum]|uniref:Uncharacterized protein n=1 Tax=Natrarchaeobaculum aegyptiacum TaxID=745377 RepID=A0A2Z2HWK3_9EURY|nr:hypothetical protein [Natrarchaeobaculum aegyptiacum]ARS89987.1 hypothetical protein B1756_09775 [Natrarchaeobaculum aegyptiacum]
MEIETEPVFLVLPALVLGFVGIVFGGMVGLGFGLVVGLCIGLTVVTVELASRVATLEARLDDLEGE